jgi:hypothetical protein
MCRSIKNLRNGGLPPSDGDIHAAALQYIRKVSGYRKPSRINQNSFDQAVNEVAESTRNLLENLKTSRSDNQQPG